MPATIQNPPIFSDTLLVPGIGQRAPRSVAIVDFNLDGKQDVIVANGGAPNGWASGMSVFLGDGAGGFGPQIFTTGVEAPYSVVVGDINGDGLADAVVANGLHQDSVSIMLGLGDGTFTSISQPTAAGARCAGIGDLDGNGKVDIVVGCQYSNTVAVLLQNANGSYATYFGMYTGPNTSPWMPAIGDLNNDGIQDMVVALHGPASGPTSNQIAVLFGLGGGAFGAIAKYIVGTKPEEPVLADMNGDGYLDCAVVNEGGGVSILINGPHSFALSQTLSAGAIPTSLVKGDFNGDNITDLAVCAQQSNNITLFLGDGSGSFPTSKEFPGYSLFASLAAGDFNNDGRPDLAAAATAASVTGIGTVSIFLADGPASFGAAKAYTTNLKLNDIRVADIDADGSPDIIATALGNPSFDVLLGDSVGGFLAASTLTIGAGNLGPPAIADFNQDGILDAAFPASSPANEIIVITGDGIGNFGNPTFVAVAPSPMLAAAGDLNNDGVADLVAAHTYAITGVSALLNNGTGSLYLNWQLPANGVARAIRLADLNNDGNLDVLYIVSSCFTALGDGQGFFGTPSIVPLSGSTNLVDTAAGDLQKDGNLDVGLLAINSGGYMGWLPGDGTGSLGTAVFTNLPLTLPLRFAVGDLTGDGNVDTIIMSDDPGGLCLFRGDGLGGWSAPETYAGVGVFVLTDVNKDGRLDIVRTATGVNNWGGNYIMVQTNQLTTPAGLSHFGTGTPSCAGTIAMNGNSIPAAGNTHFGMVASNATPSSLGLLLVMNVIDIAGNDYFGVGIKIHLNPVLSTDILAFNIISDTAGAAFTAAPIPNNPSLQGLTYFAQAIFVESSGCDCSGSAFGLSSSTGLAIQIQ
ncbi:MAG: VCBS repeat-containing protein [Planctomycetes bacterium]|nr:VCBS repeat-containing protein [Planctomycetota bacterium]